MADTDGGNTKPEFNGKIISLPDKLILRSNSPSIIMIERIGSKANEWQIDRGEGCYVSATVSDTDFLLKMEEGLEEVARGEYLAVELETTQTLDIKGKLTVSFDIKRVLKHSLFAKPSEAEETK